MLEGSLDRLRAEYEAAGNAGSFALLRPCLMGGHEGIDFAVNLTPDTQPSLSAGAGDGVPTARQLAPVFPAYEIGDCLGRGGMGVVYQARQKSLNRPVAIKILAPEREASPAFAERFAAEAEMLARLSHPNIVTIHDFGESGGYFYLLGLPWAVSARGPAAVARRLRWFWLALAAAVVALVLAVGWLR
ncbi:hypothetical protein BH23VER1_BH23VER1_33950 [soil metagenome]